MPDVTVPPLPEKPVKRSKMHAPELLGSYAARFGLHAADLRVPRLLDLLQAKINSDIFIAQQRKRIAALEGKIEGLLGFIERKQAKEIQCQKM